MKHEDTPATELPGKVLVRRMSHDFNNLFSVVLGGLSLLREEIDAAAWDDDANETYRDIVSATREAADAIAKLTAWAGRQALDPERLDLREVARDAVAATRERCDARIGIDIVCGDAPVIAWADRNHLRGCIAELIVNACDALGGTGSLRIEVGYHDRPRVTVVDEGLGMNTEALAACREPYFTTRTDLGRRGLGLCVVDGFARASHGTLRIDSEPGRGTSASIELPAEAADARPA